MRRHKTWIWPVPIISVIICNNGALSSDCATRYTQLQAKATLIDPSEAATAMSSATIYTTVDNPTAPASGRKPSCLRQGRRKCRSGARCLH
eukprot:2953107-Amphidinium_carterae.1